MRAGLTRFVVLALASLVLLGAGVAWADIIYLKDGFAIQGKVRREVNAEFDPVAREMIYLPKGFFSLDDEARYTYFSPTQVRVVEKLDAPMEERIVSRNVRYIAQPRKMMPILEVLETGPWEMKKWEREFFFRSTPPSQRVGLKQAIARISPYYCRVDAINKFWWVAAYLTREFEPETIAAMLANHPDFRPRGKETPAQVAGRRLRLCDFYAQAGMFALAQAELDRLRKEQPREGGRLAAAQATLDRLRGRDEWEEVKRWHEAGRYTAVGKRLEAFPSRGVSDRVLADVREMQGQLRAALAQLGEARTALEEYTRPERLTTAEARSLASAAGVLRSELHPTNVERLDAFLGQVREAARRQARGAPAQMTTEQLLSLAVSGWLLGSASAEARPVAAVNLWKTRQMVLEYQNEGDGPSREKILADYAKRISPRVDIDEVAQLIGHLPPPAPAADISTRTQERPLGGVAGAGYLLKLPPEYTHNRPYPVVIVLADGKDRPESMLEQWEKYAADNGCILAAPRWSRNSSEEYGYKVQEHDAVLDTLRDLRRSYQIDSDRVFLFGVGEGGKMAFDVGLAHPDCFAGVMPMAAGPVKFPRRYWRNAQYLPFYVTSGTRGGESSAQLRTQFENWVLRGFPAIWVDYKGRGTEFFKGELPMLFDWMRLQRRAFPMRQLGTPGGGGPTGTEFCTMREEDNRFYWLGLSKIGARHLGRTDRWSNQTTPAIVTATVNAQANSVLIRTQGIGHFTVWVGRNPNGQYMLDLDRPVAVSVNNTVYPRRKVAPSLAVLLEDLYQRGDRKQLFVAKLEVLAK